MDRWSTNQDFNHPWAAHQGRSLFSEYPVRKATATSLILLFLASPLNLALAQEAALDASAQTTTGDTSSTPPASQPLDPSALDAALQSSGADPSAQTTDTTPSPEGQPIPQTGTPDGTTEESNLAPSEIDNPSTDAADENPTEETPPIESLSSSQETPQVINPTFTYQSIAPRVDKTTGALVETIKLAVPPGRNGLQPDLALVYNSQRLEEGVFGYGWDINIPYIERINRRGTDNLYSDDYFSSSLSGELASTTVSGQYRARVEEGAFVTYTLSATSTGGQWVAYDKKGTKYTFGTSTLSRIDNSGDTTKVFRWMLEEIRDTNSNYIRYEYYKDNGQIYPSKIYYTGNGTTDGVFTVEFSRESRSDAVTSYKPGFLVKTNYRINQILAKYSGTWVRKYDLAFAAGTNGYRSLLTSITETGQDEAGASTVSLPATTFEYSSTSVGFTDYSGSTMLKVQGAAWALADTEGNGLLDQNISFNDPVSGYDKNFIELNFNEGSISDSSTFNPPYYDELWAVSYNGPNTYQPQEKGTRFFDFNGDGLADVLRSYYDSVTGSTTKRVYWNASTYYTTGALAWTLSTSSPSMPLFGSAAYTLGLFANLNGDGLIDFEEAHTLGDTNGAYFGTGSSLTASTSNFTPITSLPYLAAGKDRDIRLVDINADGLDDWVYNDSGTMKVCLNTGLAWDSGCSSGFNLATTTVDSSGNDKGVRFLDLNGDGLLDWVRSYSMASYTSSVNGTPEIGSFNVVKLNTGSGWATTTISLPYYIATGRVESSQFMGDFTYNEMWDWSGDGAADAWKKKNDAGKQDMLKKINYTTGGYTQVTYEHTAGQLAASQPKHNQLPMTVFVVSSIVNNDGQGTSDTATYTYDGGDLYFSNPYDRKLAGFETITESKSDSVTKTHYYQGNVSSTTVGEFSDHYAKIGKPYREDVLNATSSATYKRTFYYWDRLNQGTNRDFVSLASTSELTFDGDSDHKDKATTFTYATSTGNVIQKIEWGEVSANTGDGTFSDTGSDVASTTISYAASSTVNMSLPHTETTQDQSLNKVKETRYYYDSLGLGTTTKGNLTKEERWITGSTYASTTKTYNATYGLVTQETDPRAKTTTYTIDSNNLYVATSTNPLSQTTGFQYDYSSGKVKQLTDPNNRVFIYTFDALDRLTEEKQPDIATPSTLVTKSTYTYTNGAVPQRVLKSAYLNSATTTDTYAYVDGLGRKIQERKEAEGTNTFAVKDWTYNDAGKLSRETLPYFASSTSWATSTAGNGIVTNYVYDALGRATAIGTAVGTTTNAHDDWKTTTTDTLGKQKDFYRDGYGNLINVVEHIGTTTATTTYDYNRRNDLTKITDASSNVRNFTYDGLSRRLTAEDLHASGDATFGTWTYTYDDGGNITSQVDPKSQTVNYTYDDLSRVLTENYTGSAGTEAFYGYDFCGNGKSQQCSATTTNTVSKYSYNAIGLVSSESRNIASTSYTTSYEYDRQGNPTIITYPDNSQVQYLMNDAGLPEIIQYRQSTSTAFSNVINGIDYTPLEQQSYFAYANNTKTCNSYDSNELYRLKTKRSTAQGYGCTTRPYPAYATSSPNVITHINVLQDLSYTYDSTGNITSMQDTSASGLARAVTYTYDDVGRLTFASTTVASSTAYRYAYTYDALGNITKRNEGFKLSSTNTHSLDLERDSNQYASIDNDLGITNGSISFEAWVKFESLPAGVNTWLYGKGDSGTNVEYNTYFYNVSSSNVSVYINRQRNGIGGCSTSYTGWNPGTTNWHHIVETYDGSTIRLYIDGADTGTSMSCSGDGSSSTSDRFSLGIDPIFTSAYAFDGKIDDVRVWNTALSSSTISSHYASPAELVGNEANLRAYYKLNNSYADATANAYTLTGANSPVFTYEETPFGGNSVGTPVTYAYGGTGYANPHALTSYGNGTATSTLGYDNNGNLLAFATTSYAYDYRNRITQIIATSTATSTYVYDTNNDRVRQSVASTTTFFPNKLYSVASTTAWGRTNSTSTVYIYAGDALVATVDRLGTSTAAVRSLHTDHLSSASVVTDASGDLARAEDYYPFGAPRMNTVSGIAVTEYTSSSTPSTNTHSLDLERDSTQYASINNDLGITGGAITISAWLKLEAEPSAGQTYGIAHQVDDGNDVTYFIYYDANTPTNNIVFGRGKPGVGNQTLNDGVNLGTSSWHQLALTYDGSTLRAYRDGTEVGNRSASGNGSYGITDRFLIGSYDAEGSIVYPYDGKLDDVRVYNRALSPSEISDSYTAPNELQGNETGLVAYYKLNNSYGDSTANAYNLTGANSPTFSTDVPTFSGGSTSTSTTYYYTYNGGNLSPLKQYIGQYFDDGAAPTLSYLNARYYDPGRGQFLSQDPVFWEVGLTQDGRNAMTNPQLLNSYNYGANNPIVNSDPQGRGLSDYLLGTWNAYASDQVLGAGRMDPGYYTGSSQHDYASGQSLGDTLALFGAALQIAGGTTIGTAGAVATVGTGGAAAAVSVPAAASGALLVTQGLSSGATAAYNLSSGPKAGESGGSGAGKKFSDSVKNQARQDSGNKCVFCGSPTTKRIGSTQSQIDHAVSKFNGGNNTLQNAQNTCRTCNLQKGVLNSIQFVQKRIVNVLKSIISSKLGP